MQVIDRSWLEPLLSGGTFLGSGGGGEAGNSTFLLKEILANIQAIHLMGLEELDPEEFYAGVGMIGSPELMEEHFPTSLEGIDALERLKVLAGREFRGLMTIECATVNILYPLLVACRAQLPLIDADAMGRAFPEIQMTAFNFAGLPSTPMAVIDGRGQSYDFTEEDNFLMELNRRRIVGEGGGIGFFAGFPYRGGVLKRVLIPGTISFAYDLGRVFMNPGTYSNMLDNLIRVTKNSIYGSAIELFTGSVVEKERMENLGWRAITIRGSGSYAGEEFKILTQNESLIAYRQNRVAAMVPDLISIIDMKTLRPVYNSDLFPGMEVAVIGTPAPLPLKTRKNLDVVGPRYFGCKSGYEPLEKLYYFYYYK